MIAEFIIDNSIFVILISTLITSVLIALMLVNQNIIYGVLMFVFVLGFVFFVSQTGSILDKRAEAVCSEQGLNYYGRYEIDGINCGLSNSIGTDKEGDK